SDGNGSHWSTSKTPSYTKSVSWQHHRRAVIQRGVMKVTILAQTPWLMLFRMSGEEFLCLEPQTHPVNAHNMQGQPGLQVLAQGERCHFAMQISVE
ncbi:hypothetical protein ACK6T0_21180, partial [Citrobacter freundii]